MTRRLTVSLIALLLHVVLAAGAAAEDITDVDQIVDRANLAAYYAGGDGRSDARMLIVDGRGREQMRQFTILRRNRAQGGDQDFMVFFSRPSDVRGTVFRVAKHVDGDDDRWLYLPGLDLVKRISAGDKRTSFVGSNFFYEDVSGRNPADDEHELVETDDEHYILDNRPRDPSSVEFESYRVWIDKRSFLPVKIEYRNETGKVYRRVEVLEVKDIQGFPTVTKSRVEDLETGGQTTMEFRYIAYDLGIGAEIFSERSMRNPPREWLKRPGS